MDGETYSNASFAPGDRIVLCHEGGVFRSELGVPGNGAPQVRALDGDRGEARILADQLLGRAFGLGAVERGSVLTQRRGGIQKTDY